MIDNIEVGVEELPSTSDLAELYAMTRITSYAEWYTQYKADHGMLTFFQWLREVGLMYRLDNL